MLVSPDDFERGTDGLAMTTAGGDLITVVLSAYNASANNDADVPDRAAART